MDAEFSGVTYSGSIQSSLLYHGSLFSDTSSSYALNFYLQSVLNFERISSSSLETDFIEAVQALPTTITIVEEQQKYFDFFDDYGTHYTSFATMGGTIVMETQIDDSVFESYSSVEVTAGVSAGYNSVISNGTLSASAAYSSTTNTFLKDTSSKVTLNVMGGIYFSGESISDWATSIYSTPSILLTVPTQTGSSKLTTLTAISNLVQYAVTDKTDAENIANNINNLFHSYMMQDAYADSLLTSPQDINFSQVDPDSALPVSQGDGFVISTVQETQSGSRGYIQAFDDTTPNPTTIRATASQHFDSGNDTWIPYASLTMPTPANTSYTSEFTPTLSSSASLKFVGLGNIGEEGMGEWQELKFVDHEPIIQTAENDGFVLAYVDGNNTNKRQSRICSRLTATVR
ncbi:MAG: MAC/perforin domain-containing protein [Prochloraceae cyanobacterium]